MDALLIQPSHLVTFTHEHGIHILYVLTIMPVLIIVSVSLTLPVHMLLLTIMVLSVPNALVGLVVYMVYAPYLSWVMEILQ